MHQLLITFFLIFLFQFQSVLIAKEKADYVVIGVGTAGATIAKLLSDNQANSVIALHNGKDLQQDPDIKLTKNAAFVVISALFGSSFFNTGDSIQQPNIDNRELLWAMGKPEGGDSSINAGAWARGTNQVYSQWEAIAGPEWSTTVILNTYRALENYHGNTSNPAARGFNGPIDVRQVPNPTPLALKFTQAVSTATGVPIIVDDNDPNTPIGVTPQLQYTQKGPDGSLRVSSATAFLNESIVTRDGKGVNGRRLKIKFKSTALRTIWEGNKAVGVEYFHNGKIKKVYASKGVIVCGGLYSSAFLMHSGVGPKQVLEPLGIRLKFDNPNVGQALADQDLFLVAFATNPADTPISPDNTCSSHGVPGGVSFALNKPFILSVPSALKENKQDQLINSFLCNGYAFPGNSIFSMISWLPAPGGDPNVRQVRFTITNPVPGLAVGLFDLVQPKSRGYITINSFNPLKPPVFNNGMFSNPDDLTLYVQAFKTYIKNINIAIHAIDNQYELIYPLPALLDDDLLLAEFIKDGVASNQCYQSHCRMAPLNQGGVVDSRGKVYGVENLYVADDSIVPVAMDGTPMASAYLIAANIARLLSQN